MKRATLFVLLLLGTFAPAARTPDEYPINVHVTSSYYASALGTGQEMDVLIDGKKFQLSGVSNGNLLSLGDYKAKLVKDEHRTAYESAQQYELLFPDKKTRKFSVVGQSE